MDYRFFGIPNPNSGTLKKTLLEVKQVNGRTFTQCIGHYDRYSMGYHSLFVQMKSVWWHLLWTVIRRLRYVPKAAFVSMVQTMIVQGKGKLS